MIGWIKASYVGLPIYYVCTVRSGMDFGPANFPAVIDIPTEYVWIIQKTWPLNSCILTQLMAILNFQQAIALLHTADSWEDDIHRSPQIQIISLDEPIAAVLMLIHDVPLFSWLPCQSHHDFMKISQPMTSQNVVYTFAEPQPFVLSSQLIQNNVLTLILMSNAHSYVYCYNYIH